MAAPDMSGMAAMADHWVKMQKLPPKEAIKGCPNFRRIPGYKVNFYFSPFSFSFSSSYASSFSSLSLHLFNLLFQEGGSGPCNTSSPHPS